MIPKINFLDQPTTIRHISHIGCAITLAITTSATLAQDARPAVPGSAAAPITLHYNARIPFEYLEGGAVKGLLATPIEQVFKKAGVAFVWAETPSARQFALVQKNVGADCLAGRFKTDDRAQWARFSKPVYRDRPQGLLARSNNTSLPQFASLAEAVRAPQVALLVKASYSYGSALGEAISQRSTPARATYDESMGMLRQIHRGMADAFIISADEAEGLLAQAELPARDFAFISYPGTPQGELRYIMCSHQVPPSVMDSLNAAIGFKDR